MSDSRPNKAKVFNLIPESDEVRIPGPVRLYAGASYDLNIVQFPAGMGPQAHVNQIDAFIVVLEGDIQMTAGDEEYHVAQGQMIVVPAGLRRGFEAGKEGARLLAAHINLPE